MNFLLLYRSLTSLFEWLKHSKKKPVCELCSTPYKFTKLYAPDMPSHLPILVLGKKGLRDAIEWCGAALRINLGLFLWLVLLPFIAAHCVRVYTLLAEGFSSTLTLLVNPKALWSEKEGGSVNRLLPFRYLKELSGTQIPFEFARDVFEGQIVIIIFFLLFFTVMIVREWILQNEIFINEQAARDGRDPQNNGQDRRENVFGARRMRGRPHDNLEDRLEDELIMELQRQAVLVEMRPEAQQPQPQERQRLLPDPFFRHPAPDEAHAILREIEDQIDEDDEDDDDDVHELDENDHGHDVEPIEDQEEQINGIRNDLQPRDLRGILGDDRRDDFLEAEEAAAAAALADPPPAVEEADGLLDFAGLRGPIQSLLAMNLLGTLVIVTLICFLYFVPYMTGRTAVYILVKKLLPQIWRLLLSTVGTTVKQYGVYISGKEELRNGIGRVLLRLEKRHAGFWLSLLESVAAALNDLENNTDIPGVGVFSRVICISAGYSIIFGALGYYADSRIRFAVSRQGMVIERTIVQFIHQGQAILKVIIITGIELVGFPIFCGILLDLSFLPLIDGLKPKTMIAICLEHPIVTTAFHWVIGTTYMFIFALFVSMCRKIMRPGVLYFIRDPNDPNFHPIRDVLERSIPSQLGKICISGMIYTVLITVCLGGVVYCMRYVFHASFLPLDINSSFLAFDFNFNGDRQPAVSLVDESLKKAVVSTGSPLNVVTNASTAYTGHFGAVLKSALIIIIQMFGGYALGRGFRSLNILTKYWTKVFTQTCSLLRLSSFILNRPHPEEQGYIYSSSLMTRLFGPEPDYSRPVTLEQAQSGEPGKNYFIRDGNFVRAPDTDSIPSKNKLKLFIPVNRDDERIDGREQPDEGELSNYHVVYRPPYFKLRVSALLVLIWFFGTIAVLSVTVVPLMIGKLFLSIFSAGGNDLISCDIGIFPVYGVFVVLDKWDIFIDKLKNAMSSTSELKRSIVKGILKVSFAIFALAVLPLSVGTLVDLYLRLSVELLYEPSAPIQVFLVENCLYGTVALLIGKVLVVNQMPNSPQAQMYRRMVEQGWLDYDLKIACLYFTLPVLGFVVAGLGLPFLLHYSLGRMLLFDTLDSAISTRVLRSCFLVVFVAGGIVKFFGMVIDAIKRWETQARDQVYLIGERLENLE